MDPRSPGLAGALPVALSVLTVLAVCPVPGFAQELEVPQVSLSPLQVFASLESFWNEGQADSLIVRLCPDETRLSFRRIGPRDGSFDHSQAKYLLADLFEFARTDSFFFTEYEYDPTNDDPPRAVGHWFFKGANRIDREARVTIELIPHDRSWAISEIEANEW